MTDNRKRMRNISNEQKTTLVEYLETHKDLKIGKFTKDFTFKKAQTMWEEISIILNSIPGVQKDWKQWRKTWHDLRTNAKSKKSKLLKHQRGTGGGSPIDDVLTPVEDRIVDMIGTTAIEGNTSINESATIFNFEEIIPEEHQTLTLPPDTSTSTISTSILHTPTATTLPLTTHPLPPIIPITSTNTTQPKTFRQRQGVQRLQKTVAATARLADATDTKLRMKEEYYKQKLTLYKKDICVKKRIAVALEKILRRMPN